MQVVVIAQVFECIWVWSSERHAFSVGLVVHDIAYRILVGVYDMASIESS